MNRRVVITGLGAVTPVGNDVPTMWSNLLAGKGGAGPITLFDAAAFKTKFACEVKDFDAGTLIGKKDARRMDRFTQLAVVAAQQALQDSALIVNADNTARIGVYIGSGIGGIGTMEAELRQLITKGPDRVSPFLVPMMLPDTASGQVAIQFGLRGPNMAIVTACASGNNAIGEATECIRRGAADVMVTGGAEAGVTPLAVAGFNSMTAISTRNDAPEIASRPFDKERDGFVIGEGAGILVLEELEPCSGARRKDLWRSARLWRDGRCLSHHGAGREWRGRSARDAGGHAAGEFAARSDRLHQRARHQYAVER